MFPIKNYKYNLPKSGIDPGGFGTKRKFDIHTGIDLYCELGDDVFAIEDGEVVDIHQFTGGEESPWWKDTFAVVVRGKSGFILYGEIEPIVKIGDKIKENDVVGKVIEVLKKEKPKNPKTMLHIELYSKYNGSVWWKIGDEKPDGLEDPEKILRNEREGIIKFSTEDGI
jgi:murein DD-endopeptidase MepM/ murein hydrolase activator NlpD